MAYQMRPTYAAFEDRTDERSWARTAKEEVNEKGGEREMSATTIHKRRGVDEYGISTASAKPAPTYKWMTLPDTPNAQESYLTDLLNEIDEQINALASEQYLMPPELYREQIEQLYERKRVVLAARNPYNQGRGSRAKPTLSCGWMRSVTNG
jgi:hypothetical protein